MVYSGPWRTVNSLQMLRTQVNIAWPGRSKASDGTIADASHSTTSDHYPHLVAGLGTVPVVTAFDLTQDPAHGCDCASVSEAIRLSRDYRVKYVIWNHRMYSSYASGSYPPFAWRPYTGSNDPHTNHMHVSVHDAPAADVATPWAIGVPDMPLTAEEYAEIVRGSLTDDNVMHYDLRSILDGEDPALSGYHQKGWTKHVGLRQLAEALETLTAKLDELAAAVESIPVPVDGFTEEDLRRFAREETEATFVRAHYRVDPAV